jgi:hypothetical protein
MERFLRKDVYQRDRHLFFIYIIDISEKAENHYWDDTYGDRIIELVFIGIDFDKDEIIKNLDYCLLNTDEMLRTDWNTFSDLLPAFAEKNS